MSVPKWKQPTKVSSTSSQKDKVDAVKKPSIKKNSEEIIVFEESTFGIKKDHSKTKPIENLRIEKNFKT